jgi:hypothetical protein
MSDPKHPMTYPWWKADEETWVPASGVPIKVVDIPDGHLEGILTFLAKWMEPAANHQLRLNQMLRAEPGFEMGDMAEDGYHQFLDNLSGCSEGAVVCLAYPAAIAVVTEARARNLDFPESLDVLDNLETFADWCKSPAGMQHETPEMGF